MEDAHTLRGSAQRIAEIVLDREAFGDAEKKLKNSLTLSKLPLSLASICGILPIQLSRARREHLARGYDIVAAGRYVLYGETRGRLIISDDQGTSVKPDLPSDIENFPQLPNLRDGDDETL